ncbi:MAG: Spy/CpxP family protein refolding chaperone [Bryobacteraceae bacterium]
MKSKWLRLMAVPAMAGGLMLTAVAQTPDQPAAPAQQHAQRWQKRQAMIAGYLNLTPAQQEAAKAEMQSARESAQPVWQQLKQVRQQMLQAIRANDANTIQQLATQEGVLKGQLTAIRNQTMAKLYAGLTPEQKAKADQLPAHFRQMRHRHMQNQQPANNG